VFVLALWSAMPPSSRGAEKPFVQGRVLIAPAAGFQTGSVSASHRSVTLMK
jgi:hypothetical protein